MLVLYIVSICIITTIYWVLLGYHYILYHYIYKPLYIGYLDKPGSRGFSRTLRVRVGVIWRNRRGVVLRVFLVVLVVHTNKLLLRGSSLCIYYI